MAGKRGERVNSALYWPLRYGKQQSNWCISLLNYQSFKHFFSPWLLQQKTMITIENDIVAGDILLWLRWNFHDSFGSIGNGRHLFYLFSLSARSKVECEELWKFPFCNAFIFFVSQWKNSNFLVSLELFVNDRWRREWLFLNLAVPTVRLDHDWTTNMGLSRRTIFDFEPVTFLEPLLFVLGLGGESSSWDEIWKLFDGVKPTK